MGHIFDDPLANSMASPNRDDTLEKDMTFTFGAWTCVADGSGGFSNHLDDHTSVELDSTNPQSSNNSAA